MKKHKVLPFLIWAIAWISLPAGSDPIPATNLTSAQIMKASSPIIEGYQITESMNKDDYNVGEPIYMSVSVTNVTSHNIHFLFMDYASIENRLNYTVTTQAGKAVPMTAGADYKAPDFTTKYQRPLFTDRPPRVLGPGAILKFRLLLNAVYDLSVTDDYEVSVEQRVSTLDDKGSAVLQTAPMAFRVSDPQDVSVSYDVNPSISGM